MKTNNSNLKKYDNAGKRLMHYLQPRNSDRHGPSWSLKSFIVNLLLETLSAKDTIEDIVNKDMRRHKHKLTFRYSKETTLGSSETGSVSADT